MTDILRDMAKSVGRPRVGGSNPTRNISYSIDATVQADFDVVVQRLGMTRSEALRKLIDRYIADNADLVPQQSQTELPIAS